MSTLTVVDAGRNSSTVNGDASAFRRSLSSVFAIENPSGADRVELV